MTRLKSRSVVLGVAGLVCFGSLVFGDDAAGKAKDSPTLRPASKIKPMPTTVDQGPRPHVSDPYGLDRARLGVLGANASEPVGSTPHPSAAVQRRYDRYVEGVIDADNTLDLVVGRPRILEFRQAPVRVQIPDNHVARYDVITDRELSVTGVDVGSTLLNIWFTDPNNADKQEILSYLVRVLPDPELKDRLDRDFRLLEDQINKAFPSAMVSLKLLGQSVIVQGQAKDAFEAERIMQIVRSNAPLIEGYVPTEGDDPNTTTFGTEYTAGAGSTTPTGRYTVVNLLSIPGASQVALKVTIAEVNRSAARSIGLNFTITNDGGTNLFQQLTGAAAGFVTNLPVFLDNGQVQLAINALRTLALARSLAEPTLVAMNGESASFLSGGEFPVPVVTGATAVGLQGVQYIPFGVSLTFTPTVLDRDRIRLSVAAEVSTRSLAQGEARVGNTNVPNLDTRNFQTVVELRSGQTLAVAGLIQQDFGSNGDRVPGLGDLPIIGGLFGYNRTTSSEQELVITVTPQIVMPMDPNVTPTNLPGSDIFEPDDIEFYLLSRLESRHTEDARASVMTTPDRLGRQRQLEKKFIVGPAGHADGQ